jgi:hypothetical protein
VGRAEQVGQVEERVLDPERPEPNGSTHQASIPAENSGGAAQVLVQGGLVDDGARATFTRTAVGFIRLSSRAPISPGGAVNSSAKLPATGADSG